MKHFVMLNTQSGRPIPLLAEDSTEFNVIVALYDSEADAKRAAEANPLGEVYGYGTYEWS